MSILKKSKYQIIINPHKNVLAQWLFFAIYNKKLRTKLYLLDLHQLRISPVWIFYASHKPWPGKNNNKEIKKWSKIIVKKESNWGKIKQYVVAEKRRKYWRDVKQ